MAEISPEQIAEFFRPKPVPTFTEFLRLESQRGNGNSISNGSDTQMNSPYPIPTTPSRMKITPEIAADWLENRNAQAQRRLSDHIAKKYAEAMKNGRFLFTHQGVAFDVDGFLIDGQHRLRAVVISGVTVEMFVIPGCDPATFAVLDNGHKRQAAHLMGGSNPRVAAAAARVLGVITSAVPISGSIQDGIYDTQMPTNLVLEVADQWPELNDFMPGVTQAYRYAKIVMPMHLAVVVQASRTRHRDRLGSWFDGLTTGAGLNPTDPRLLLRNRFTRDGRLLVHARGQSYNLIVKAWNAHALGRPLGVLRVTDAEGVVGVAS